MRGKMWLLASGLGMLVLLMLQGAPLLGGGMQDKKDDKEPSPPKTFTATLERMTVDLPVKGHLESETMTELMLKPDSWSQFQVVKAVPHGTVVKAGDQLVWLDLTKIDEAIKDTELAQAAADLAHKLALEEFRFFEKLVPLDLAAAEVAKRRADEDLQHYLEKDKQLTLEGVDQNYKSSLHQMEYTEEELKQLEKMYRAKDLTEDTEELILKRQRRMVDAMKYYLRMAEVSRDRQLKTDLPRRERDLVEANRRAAINFERTAITLPMQLRQRKLAIEAATRERAKADERLEKLRKDREMMVITAPVAGTVYYGRNQKGQFSSGAGIEQQLLPAGNLVPNQVFMTIVDTSKLAVRGNVEEKDRHLVRVGVAGKATPTAFPDLKFACTVAEISEIPSPTGGFDCLLRLEGGSGFNQLRPGMAVTSKLRVYSKDNALTVPDAAVFKEDADEDERFVYLSLKKDGKYVHEKRAVKVGKKSGSKVEILEGLSAGDAILQAKPEN